MAVEFYVQGQPQHAHENQALLKLAQLMQRAFAASAKFYLLAANVRFWKAQADALVLTPRAVILIELKSCADAVYGRARGAWHVLPGGDKIRGGSYDNPYQQIVANRETLIKYLDRNRRRFLSRARAREMAGQWGHVSAALVFSPYLHPDSDVVVPPASRAWLGVVGLNETAEFLFSRFSPQIDLRPQELRCLAVEALGCQRWDDVEALLPPVSGRGHLWLLDENGQRTYAVPVVDAATIGRSRDNTLVVPRRYSRTSRQHARLRIVGDVVWLCDDDSTHGTFVNGQPVAPGQGQPLCDGDHITLGDADHPGACRLRFDRRVHLDTPTQSTAATQT
jgi:hypothetical protein